MFEKLGAYASYPWRGLLQNHYFLAPPFQEGRLGNFDLSIDQQLSGREGIVINFKAKKLSRRLLEQNNVASYEGKIWISETDNLLSKTFFDISYENGDRFSTSLFYEVVDQELVPVRVQEESVIAGRSVSSQSGWLKSVPYTDQPLIMNHDFVSVRPSEEAFEVYNQFVEEKE